MPALDERGTALFEGLRDGKVELLEIVRELGWTVSQVNYYAMHNGYLPKPSNPLDDRAIFDTLLEFRTGQISEYNAARLIFNIVFKTLRYYPRKRYQGFTPPKHTDQVVDRYRRGDILWPAGVGEALGCSEGVACSLLADRGVLRTNRETEELIEQKLASPEAMEIFSSISAIINSTRNT